MVRRAAAEKASAELSSNAAAFVALLKGLDHRWGVDARADALAVLGRSLAVLIDTDEATAQIVREYRAIVQELAGDRGDPDEENFGSDMPAPVRDAKKPRARDPRAKGR